ncbi:hypothetical protein [Sphingomonas xanthus]|uniref:Uncharacterized protein n=1 Tax=Sphingomonas xanthus TaxID=2594473 RepID=A0A516IUD0_9SPHN|nr:hypothetical protein [Sphingomonas xanthus]QDP20444.1 hypothetical protein FMM02_11050 [Sphingomonas xanthus]
MASTFNQPNQAVRLLSTTDPVPFDSQAEDAPQEVNCSVQIPVPRRRASAIMRSLATAIGDRAMPLCMAGQAGNIGFRLPDLGITILGTGCHRPLLCEQAQDMRLVTGDHMLIVRIEDEAHGYGPFTLDLLMSGTERWLTRYRLWQIHPTADLWLVPSQGEGRSVRVLSGYLAASPRAPFFSLFEREHGCAVAAQSLAARQGDK